MQINELFPIYTLSYGAKSKYSLIFFDGGKSYVEFCTLDFKKITSATLKIALYNLRLQRLGG